jgi:UDP-N-acetylmuramate--alanine ligase
MSPLARLMRARGHQVQGSDRAFDRGKSSDVRARLASLGIAVVPHDGSAVTAGLDRFVHSTAVEPDTPEFRAASALGLERWSRPAFLAGIVNGGHPGVAIAGTSGKSTVTGMAAWLLREAGRAATVLGGAALVGEGGGGCLVAGPDGGAVVAEACESDGSLPDYCPAIGVIHNVSRDHGEVEVLRPQFAAFAARCGLLLVNAACPEAAAIGRSARAHTYGVAAAADTRLDVLSTGPHRAVGVLHGPLGPVRLDVPQPGRHNLENAAAAALVALQLGVPPRAVETLIARFPGVARRFEVVGTAPGGIRVVDDYAHNGEKIRAALTAARAGAARVVAVFQPHGFGPARFLRAELAGLLPRLLRPGDSFCYAEVFYAGGTVTRDVSSRMLASDLPAELRCDYAPDHDAVVRWACAEARPGDTVLLMGARDPDLPRLARAILEALCTRMVPLPLGDRRE